MDLELPLAQRAFEIFGVLGVVWAVAFYLWFRDDPREHPSVNAAERALLTGTANLASAHANVPWRRFLGAPTTWLLWGQYLWLFIDPVTPLDQAAAGAPGV